MTDWLETILEKPAAKVPDVARALGIGRNQAYEAVREGRIPSERYGRRIIVPTAWLRRTLKLDGQGDP